MNRVVAGGRTDTERLSEQRICPSKVLMKLDRGGDDNRWWLAGWMGGWMEGKMQGKGKSKPSKELISGIKECKKNVNKPLFCVAYTGLSTKKDRGRVGLSANRGRNH